MFSVALSVALAGTFLLRSMVLYAVPTFLVSAFPTRDSLPESRCKSTEILIYSATKARFPSKIKHNVRLGEALFEACPHHLLPHPFVNLEPDLTVGG